MADPWSDESVYPPPLRRRGRMALALIAVFAVVCAALMFAETAHTMAGLNVCRYDEAREGVLGEDKLGLPPGRVPPDWKPLTSAAAVRRMSSDEPSGTVLDVSRCLSRHQHRVVVLVAR